MRDGYCIYSDEPCCNCGKCGQEPTGYDNAYRYNIDNEDCDDDYYNSNRYFDDMAEQDRINEQYYNNNYNNYYDNNNGYY